MTTSTKRAGLDASVASPRAERAPPEAATAAGGVVRAEVDRDRLLEDERRARIAAERALERLRGIQSITDVALAYLGSDELLRELLSRVRKVLAVDVAVVFLLDKERRLLVPRAVDGFPMAELETMRKPMGRGVSGRIALEGIPLIVDDWSQVDYRGIEGLDPAMPARIGSSVLGVPLLVDGRAIGSLMVVSKRPRRFTLDDQGLLQVVADRVAPAIERGRLADAVEAGRRRLLVLSRRLLTAHEEERRRVAIELHDELGQILTAVRVNLQSLGRAIPEASAAPLREATSSVDRALGKVRELALDLRPSVLDDLGLSAALRAFATRLSREARLKAHVTIGPFPDPGPEVGTACFRVAQAALTNVLRHAKAHAFWLTLGQAGGLLELTVRDDGIGFDPEAARRRALAGESMGLLGMEERTELLGGSFEVRSVPSGGTEVRARFLTPEASPGAGR